jgi:cytoskeletal protein CcmA (bactofilin family)
MTMMGKKQKNQPEERRIEDKVQRLQSIIAPDTSFKGNITGKDDLIVSGNLEGDIQSSGLVKVNKTGSVQGNITGRFIVFAGKLDGDIKKAEQVEIQPTARINGNINTSRLAIAEGSFLHGEIHMPQKQEPHRFVEKRQAKASEEEKSKK